MKVHHTRVYYHLEEKGDEIVEPFALTFAKEVYLDEPSTGRYLQDRNTRYTMLAVEEKNPESVLSSLRKKHPWHAVIIDQVEWIS